MINVFIDVPDDGRPIIITTLLTMRRSTRILARSLQDDAVGIKTEKRETSPPLSSSLSPPPRKVPRVEIKYEAEPAAVANGAVAYSAVTNSAVKFPDVSHYDAGHGPRRWPEVLTHVRNTRLRTTAVVDTMGCERLPQQDVSPPQHRFQLLVALMLSAQTRDEVNSAVMASLRTELPGGLCVQGVLDVDEKELDRLIFRVGFHSRKAGYIKKSTQILRDKYHDDVPATIQEMVALPGVGPKMAHLLMHRAWGRADGIGVDVHVDRLARLWGWTSGKTPEQTRRDLESWLPKELWVEINPLLVGFGQAVCLVRPKKPRCEDCDLSQTGLCPGDRFKKTNKIKH